MGQDSNGNLSSNDRPNKESRLDPEDPFGLDPFIMGSGINTQRGDIGPVEFSDLQNASPLPLPHSSPLGENYSQNLVDVDDGLANNEAEIQATEALGSKLGVQLHNFRDMVRESVVQEGLQSGYK